MSALELPEQPTPLHPEEREKLIAETEAARAAAEASLAEAANMRAVAELNSLYVAQNRLTLADRQRQEAESAAYDERNRVYRFIGQVSGNSAASCISQLAKWDRLDPTCDIEIIFNSPGGSVIDGFALYDQIRAFSLREGGTHKITIGSRGFAASMAGILLQAGDHRWIGRNSYLMIHELSAGTGGKINEMKDDVKFYERICDQVAEIFVGRSGGKCSMETFVDSWKRQDWWLMAEDAVELGFVDEVK